MGEQDGNKTPVNYFRSEARQWNSVCLVTVLCFYFTVVKSPVFNKYFLLDFPLLLAIIFLANIIRK